MKNCTPRLTLAGSANILLDPLPETVRIDGAEVPVNWGYRACILIEMVMFSGLPDEEKIRKALDIFYCGQIPGNVETALGRMLWFYGCGRSGSGGREGSRRRQKRSYCFEQDASLIYAAFRTQYGINLNHTPSKQLHWWEFSAMFESLSDDLKICRVMYWRTTDTKGMSKREAAFIRKMKKTYALKEPESSVDSKVKLAKRNADMKAYVNRRFRECQVKGGEDHAKE